jgi:hypothetical protein
MQSMRALIGIVDTICSARTLGFPTFSVCLCVLVGCGNVSDRSLMRNFAAHEATFTELRGMFEADAELAQVWRDLVRGGGMLRKPPEHLDDIGLSTERYSEYVKRFDILGLAVGVGRGDNGAIFFDAERPSIFNVGSTKGYVYSLEAPAPLVEDLDAYQPVPTAESRRPPYLAFRTLKEHWYLFKNVP